MTGPSLPARSPFASGGLLEHLGRGALGVLAIVAAVWVAQAVSAWWAMPVSLALGVGSLVAFKGCPVCWTIGLVETAWRTTRRR
jgi:hypothetical protein